MPKKGSYCKRTVRWIFDKCIYQCNLHHRDTGRPPLPSKVVQSPPPSMAPEIADVLCHHGLVLPSRERHMHGVRECVLFFCINLRLTRVLYQWLPPFYYRVVFSLDHYATIFQKQFFFHKKVKRVNFKTHKLHKNTFHFFLSR